MIDPKFKKLFDKIRNLTSGTSKWKIEINGNGSRFKMNVTEYFEDSE